MTNITEISQWEANVPQVDTTDPVLGGTAGESNQSAIKLANRTLFLYDHMQAFVDIAEVSATATIDETYKRKLVYINITSNIVATLDALSNFTLGERVFFKCKATSLKNASIVATGAEKIYRGSKEVKIWIYDGEEICFVKRSTTEWEVIHADGNFFTAGNDAMVRVQPNNTIIANGCSPETGGTLYSRLDLARLWNAISAQAISDATWLSHVTNFREFYSSGNGTSTLRVPDMRAMSWRGLDLGRGISLSRFGSGPGGFEADAVGPHQHTVPIPANKTSQTDAGLGKIAVGGDINEVGGANDLTTSLNTGTETIMKNAGFVPVIYF